MKRFNSTQITVLVIGALATLTSMGTPIFTKIDHNDFYGLFLGITLIGSVLIDANKKPNSTQA